MMERTFSLHDQLLFSKLSNDYNPIHLDESWARKNYPGKIVVYGILIVLWVLEELISKGNCSSKFNNFKVDFLKPVLLGDLVTGIIDSTNKDKVIVNVFTQGNLVSRLTISRLTPEIEVIKKHELTESNNLDMPQNLTFDMIKLARGSVSIEPHQEYLRLQFVNSCKFFGAGTLIEILSLSSLVGMHCPGLHSMFSSFNITLQKTSLSRLYYKVIYANEKLGFAKLSVQGNYISGQVSSYFKQELAVETMPYLTFDSSTLKGRKALIIGASGIGLDAARILKAQGADVILTTFSEIRLDSPLFQFVEENNVQHHILDVTSKDSRDKIISTVDGEITSIYYFATSRILRRRLHPISIDDFNDFINVYVISFYGFIEALYLSGKCCSKICLGYPSTIAIDQEWLSQFEYFTSKLVGEYSCKLLSNRFPNISINVNRLPVLASEQSNNFTKLDLTENRSVIFNFVQETEFLLNSY